MIYKSSKLVFIFCTVLLVGCATLSSKKEIPIIPWQQHVTLVDDLKNWQLTGKISISDGNNRYSAVVTWQQQNDKYKIKFSAPIGGQYLIISKLDTNNFQIMNSEGRDEYFSSLEKITLQELGWSLSLVGFENWVKGIPVNNRISSKQLNSVNKLEYLEQNGWQINFNNYKLASNSNNTYYKNIYLPTKLYFVNETKNLKIKLFVNNWQ